MLLRDAPSLCDDADRRSTGILVTYFFVPDMSGKDLAEEDVKFMQYLRENGWEGEVGEEDEMTLAGDSMSDIETLEKSPA